MSEITIPPSPGWYLSNILACNDDGSVIAYGAKHEVVIFRPVQSSASDPVSKIDLQPAFIPLAHKDRIVAVAFGPSRSDTAAYRTHLATASDDGSVHVWDYTTETLILTQSGHGELNKVVSLDWSSANPNLIVSVSDMGSLVAWDLQSNTIRRLSLPSKLFPTVVSCCPHNSELVAIGGKSGLITIFNTKGDGFVVHKLRGHETDIVSLSWCPVSHNIFKDEANNDSPTFLLASGAKDRSIYIWRAGTDGRYEFFINLPSQPLATGGYRTKAALGSTTTHWICVRWIEPFKLLASSTFGELLEYDLDRSPPDQKGGRSSKLKPPRLIHGHHTRGLFSIAVPKLAPRSSNNRIVWTYALDKHIIACRLETAKVISDVTTIGGIVYCIASSPLDPTRIAVGTGDNKILVWNMSNDECNNVKTFWNKINSKVMAVAWHPVMESILAFGTGEGRIGVIDVNKPASAPKLFRQFHRRCVYSLIWAPPIVELSDHKVFHALFSVGDGDILQHNLDTPDVEPINLSSYFKTCDESAMVSKSLGRTDLAWNHDRSLAAVGNDNGVLYVVDGRTFNHVHTTFAHKKLVQCVAWHPATVTSENAQSPFNTWLASASDNVQVMNVTSSGVDVIASLNSHTEKVVCIAWSPHFNGLLVTASYDYTSQVWDVVSGAVLACCDSHHGAVVCVLPSAFHKDWVITGSADNTVRVWNTKNFRLTKTKTKKQRLSGALKKFNNAREATELVFELDRYDRSNHYMNGDSSSKKHVEFATNLVTAVAEPKRKPKSMFPVSSAGLSQAKHLGLLWSRIRGAEPPKNIAMGNSGYLDFFGDVKCMKRLAIVEGTHHREHGNHYQADQFSLFSGNIASSIIEASKKKQLNDWLVSMAPMVSHRLWVDSCRQYAQQLAEVGDTHKAVSYYLVIHQIEQAVDTFIDAKLFREAICLAKLRCLPNDPIVKKAVRAWANQAVATGMLSLAAHCMVSIGANIEAVEILSRSKDPENLSLASNIASYAEANEMGLSLAMRAMNLALETQNYDLAREITNNHSVLEDLNLWIDVCQLKQDWKQADDKLIIPWITGKQGDNWLGLYENAFELCKVRVPSYLALVKFLPNKPTPESDQKVWVYIAGQVSLAAAAQLKPNNGTKGVLRHLITALESAYNYHLHNPANPQYFLQLCLWISPWGPLSTLPQFDSEENCEFKTYLESFNAFTACGVVYWLEILSSKDLLPVGDAEAMKAISDVIVKCGELLFHKDVMAFHKVDVEIKRLENAIASSKLDALKIMKSCKDIEAALTKSDASTKAATNKNAQRTVDIEEDSKKLAQLKQFRADFEEKRLFTPNPFITFCSLRNVLEHTAAKSPQAQAALEKIKAIWEKSSADATTA